MKELMRDVIFKYTNILVKDDNKNLLDLPILLEYWLYVIIELEDKYNLPAIKVLENMRCHEFTLEILSKKLVRSSS